MNDCLINTSFDDENSATVFLLFAAANVTLHLKLFRGIERKVERHFGHEQLFNQNSSHYSSSQIVFGEPKQPTRMTLTQIQLIDPLFVDL